MTATIAFIFGGLGYVNIIIYVKTSNLYIICSKNNYTDTVNKILLF